MVTSTLPVSLCESTDVRHSQSKASAIPSRCHADAVLALAQTGDPDAFSELYSQHRKRVFAICLRMVRDFWLAEDLAQETFLQLHRKITTFRGDSAFQYLAAPDDRQYRVDAPAQACSACGFTRSNDDGHLSGTCWARFWHLDRTQAGVVDRVAIERAMDTLAPGYRKFFLLHDVQGLEHREIASMEGCSLGNSKSQLHKARRALRGRPFRTNGPEASGLEPMQRHSRWLGLSMSTTTSKR